jgi:hypothetical protein
MKKLISVCSIAFMFLLAVFGPSSLVFAKPPPPHPEIFIYRAYPQAFPVPYGYGLTMEYYYDLKIDEAPWRKAVSITTQVSPDGTTWYTDEEDRSPGFRWDNIHGSIVCGPTSYNLISNHPYALRVVLNYDDGGIIRQRHSNIYQATVPEYPCCNDLDWDCIPETLELALAKKFFPDAWVVDRIADLSTFYGTAKEPLTLEDGTIPFVVRPIKGSHDRCGEFNQCLEIKYGMAFTWDCGSYPAREACNGTDMHRGDSEFYAVMVARKLPNNTLPDPWGVDWETAKNDPNAWYLVEDRTSAHEGAITEFTGYGYYWRRSEPAKIYVAWGKHGGYHTAYACNHNGMPFFKDFCGENYRLRAYIDLSRLQNVGNPERHEGFDTTIGRPTEYLTLIDLNNPFDVWSDEHFGSDKASPFKGKLEADLKWTALAACLFDEVGVQDYCCEYVTVDPEPPCHGLPIPSCYDLEPKPGYSYFHCSKGCVKWDCFLWDQ